MFSGSPAPGRTTDTTIKPKVAARKVVARK
jgi:hypothetical protein